MPELDNEIKMHPMGAVGLGDGYILLCKRDKRPWLPTGEEALVIAEFMTGLGQPLHHFKQWACLRLPNGQVARSLWREKLKPSSQVRISRNVKVSTIVFMLLDGNKDVVYLWWTGAIWRSSILRQACYQHKRRRR